MSNSKNKSSKEDRLFSVQLKKNEVLIELSNVSAETKQKVGPIARVIAESLKK